MQHLLTVGNIMSMPIDIFALAILIQIVQKAQFHFSILHLRFSPILAKHV